MCPWSSVKEKCCLGQEKCVPVKGYLYSILAAERKKGSLYRVITKKLKRSL